MTFLFYLPVRVLYLYRIGTTKCYTVNCSENMESSSTFGYIEMYI